MVLYWSLAEGRVRPGSDIDLAVTGMEGSEYYRAVAALSSVIKQRVDLADLDCLPPHLKSSVEEDGIVLYAG